MYTYLRSRIWTIYFRNHAFVTWRSSGIWPMRFRSCDFVHVSDLSSWWNLRPSEASLLGEVVEFDLCASEVVTSYVFPTYLRVCFRINFRGETNCFRSFAFVHFPTPCFQINFVVLLRSCPCFERSRFALSRTSRILGKKNNSAPLISQKQNNSPQPKHSKSNFISRTITSLTYNTYPSVLGAVWFKSVLRLCWSAIDLILSATCLQFQ